MNRKLILAGLAIMALPLACTWDQYDGISSSLEKSCYPEDIARIFVTKCAVSGCHNTISKGAAGGLDMSTWEALFEGANGGTAVVPFRSDQSFLLNFINDGHDTTIAEQEPLMPYNASPLTAQEYFTIKNWVDDGAPDCNGRRFSDNPDRDKFYVSNQGCDLIYVFDAEKRVIMKAFNVGSDPNNIESPHMIRFSPDGQYYYICYSVNSPNLDKFLTSDDSFVGTVNITPGGWNTMDISSDGKRGFVIDLDLNRIAFVDMENMVLDPPGIGNPLSTTGLANVGSPHGSQVHPNDSFLYVTAQLDNKLLKVDLNSWPPNSSIINFPTPGTAKPHEVEFMPDGGMYFVTCEGTNDVKVFDGQTDAYLKSIATGTDPVEMVLVESRDLLFVTCMAGDAVSIIDTKDTTLVKTIPVGTQPHGIAADEKRGIVYVGNRNANPNGPAPHHVSSCGGRNGYLVAIDLNTLELVPGFKIELAVDPYSVRVR